MFRSECLTLCSLTVKNKDPQHLDLFNFRVSYLKTRGRNLYLESWTFWDHKVKVLPCGLRPGAPPVAGKGLAGYASRLDKQARLEG